MNSIACSRFKTLRRNQPDGFIRSGRAHVGQLLFLDDVHVQVAVAGILADDHAFVNFGRGRNEDHAALLQIEDGVAGRHAGTVRHQRPGRAHRDVALPFDVAVEQRVHDRRALGVGQHLAAQADQPARGNMKLQTHAAGAVVHHLGHLALALPIFSMTTPMNSSGQSITSSSSGSCSLPSIVRVRISGLPTCSS